MRVAIVHEWFVNKAGSENVVEQFLKIWPSADLYAVVDFLKDSERDFLQGKKAKTTFVQRLPFAKTKFRNYLALMPIAIEQLDLSGYDLIISSSHAVSKGILVGPDQLHISYVHSPIRYAWDMQNQYLEESGLDRGFKGFLTRCILHYIRLWDQRTANSVDYFVANSRFIARRIQKVYRRSSNVIWPPVDTDSFSFCDEREDFYLTASRMVSYKKIPLIVEAFKRMPTKRLIVIGDGPDLDKVKSINAQNVTVLGYQPFDVLKQYMQKCKGFVFAAEEDFGITPVEAQSCGTPVIAYGKGGVLDSVVDSDDVALRTGVFFTEQTVDSIVDAVSRFEEIEVNHHVCRANALRFSEDKFRSEFKKYVDSISSDFFKFNI